MADSGKPSAEAYNASSVAGAKTHEGALPHRLLPDGSDTLSQLAEADLREGCPDAGACHHSCRAAGPCFRVLAASPLSDWGDRWPPEMVSEHQSLDRASARPPDMDWALFAPEQEVPHG